MENKEVLKHLFLFAKLTISKEYLVRMTIVEKFISRLLDEPHLEQDITWAFIEAYNDTVSLTDSFEFEDLKELYSLSQECDMRSNLLQSSTIITLSDVDEDGFHYRVSPVVVANLYDSMPTPMYLCRFRTEAEARQFAQKYKIDAVSFDTDYITCLIIYWNDIPYSLI